MSEMEERLNAILSNPQLMQQIASMAQTMGGESHSSAQEQKELPSTPTPSIDPKLIQSMVQTVGQVGTDNHQQALLHALSPYLSVNRVQKLERAMRAAKMAGIASRFLNAGGLQMLTGR